MKDLRDLVKTWGICEGEAYNDFRKADEDQVTKVLNATLKFWINGCHCRTLRSSGGVPVMAQWLTNSARNHEVAGLTPGLRTSICCRHGQKERKKSNNTV